MHDAHNLSRTHLSLVVGSDDKCFANLLLLYRLVARNFGGRFKDIDLRTARRALY
jgi:hypothetical protein